MKESQTQTQIIYLRSLQRHNLTHALAFSILLFPLISYSIIATIKLPDDILFSTIINTNLALITAYYWLKFFWYHSRAEALMKETKTQALIRYLKAFKKHNLIYAIAYAIFAILCTTCSVIAGIRADSITVTDILFFTIINTGLYLFTIIYWIRFIKYRHQANILNRNLCK